ncbi:hypothetical protein [Limnochorda pilosa]|uniref:hypothetical protein n=1 Tax=Limnochorda pilosa TaxID=1555112 RepID=UPI00083327B4|nr:hypothetical protein [Limnochorda pilosa]
MGLGFDLSLLGTVEFPTTVPSLDARIHLGIREFDPAWIVTGLGGSYQLDGLMRGSGLDPDLHLYAGGGFNLSLRPDGSSSHPSLYLLLGMRYDLDRPIFTFVEATSYAGLAFGLGKSF